MQAIAERVVREEFVATAHDGDEGYASQHVERCRHAVGDRGGPAVATRPLGHQLRDARPNPNEQESPSVRWES